MEQKTSMLKASRLGGVLRYFTKKTLDVCGTLAACGVIASLISYAMILFVIPHAVDSMSLSFLFSANSVVMIVLCAYAACGETRYLAITPTPRYVIYAGILWKIVLFAVLASAIAALHSILDVLIAQLLNEAGLTQIPINVYDFDMYEEIAMNSFAPRAATTVGEVAQLAAREAVKAAVSMIEWGGVWYLYICLLRRWKMATLVVTIGAPILLVALMIMPAITGWMDKISAMTEAEMIQSMPMLYDLIRTAQNLIVWMVKKWPIVRAVTGVCCYAIAYPVMRSTPQPN